MAATILPPLSTLPDTAEVTIRSKTSPDDQEKIFKLFDEYKRVERRQLNSLEDVRRWREHARRELGSDELVELLDDLVREFYDNLLKSPERDEAIRMTTCQVRDCLNSANLKNLDSWNSVSCWIHHSAGRSPIPLGAFQGSWLALHVNSDAIYPQDADDTLLIECGVGQVNLKNIVGMQYRSLKERTPQTTVVHQFGSIFSTSIPENKSTNPEKLTWRDTQFVLVLEIQDNGEAGKFYIAFNPTLTGPNGERYSYQVDEDPDRMFWGKWLPLSVAKVAREVDHLPLLKDDWSKMEEIDLEWVSDKIPEFVESGIIYNEDNIHIDAFVARFANSV